VLGTGAVAGGSAGLSLSASAVLGLAGHSVTAVYSGDGSFAPSTSSALLLAAVANSAGGTPPNLAPEEFVTIYGGQLANGTAQPQTADFPTSLNGTSVVVTDRIGAVRLAGLAYVSPSQVNFLMPTDVLTGTATVVLMRGVDTVYTMQASVAPVAPGLFTADGTVAAALLVRVLADGSQVVENVSGGIDMRSDTIYLQLYGTGIRNRSDIANVICTINGQDLPATFAGPQGAYAGLDQINVLVPIGLKGAGTVKVWLTADGAVSNVATVTFR